ncbi:hypothetical protein M011DRAFT_272179 [Sporormia fimetaria CBS 119925]|uniref:Uncharacterized protein n=1 Tax=Sporormia fimetaria CBS 119925 TaxID=1340428 RepID=A0A6A6VJA7_9PLEO|nr:hypothetical protein M011DRAFT_272179 [Sporormia fimetaria CBS 119925]
MAHRVTALQRRWRMATVCYVRRGVGHAATPTCEESGHAVRRRAGGSLWHAGAPILESLHEEHARSRGEIRTRLCSPGVRTRRHTPCLAARLFLEAESTAIVRLEQQASLEAPGEPASDLDRHSPAGWQRGMPCNAILMGISGSPNRSSLRAALRRPESPAHWRCLSPAADKRPSRPVCSDLRAHLRAGRRRSHIGRR